MMADKLSISEDKFTRISEEIDSLGGHQDFYSEANRRKHKTGGHRLTHLVPELASQVSVVDGRQGITRIFAATGKLFYIEVGVVFIFGSMCLYPREQGKGHCPCQQHSKWKVNHGFIGITVDDEFLKACYLITHALDKHPGIRFIRTGDQGLILQPLYLLLQSYHPMPGAS